MLDIGNWGQLFKRLKKNKRPVTIILRTGADCCEVSGEISKIKDKQLVLFTQSGDCRRIYIPFGCICAVKTKRRRPKQRSKSSGEKSSGGVKSVESKQEVEKPNSRQLEEADAKTSSLDQVDKEEERIYGYGRKIKFDLQTLDSDISFEQAEVVELALDIFTNQESVLYYFHRRPEEKTNLGLSVLPSTGEIRSLTINQEQSQAVIRGSGLIYTDSESRGGRDFELVISGQEIEIEIDLATEKIELGPKELVGIGEQNPFVFQDRGEGDVD